MNLAPVHFSSRAPYTSASVSRRQIPHKRSFRPELPPSGIKTAKDVVLRHVAGVILTGHPSGSSSRIASWSREMAKPLVFQYGGRELSFALNKVDRAALYGHKEVEVRNEDGKVCELAT